MTSSGPGHDGAARPTGDPTMNTHAVDGMIMQEWQR